MIIYGSKVVHLKTVNSKTATCPSCNTKGSINISVFRRHAHIFWIPLFPIGKKGMSECSHCKNVLKTKEMPERIKNEYLQLKSDTKGPLWQFAGLALIIVFIAWGIYTSEEQNKLEKVYINAPKKGDVYKYKIKTGVYSTLKVVNVTKDSVFVSPNDYEINSMSKIYKIDKSENYPDYSYGISNNELKNMYESGKIYGINRY